MSKRPSPDRTKFLAHCTHHPGAGSAKLSYVLLQKLLKLSEYLPRRREARTGDADKGSANGSSSNGDNPGSVGGGRGGGGGFCFKYVITDFSHANFGFWMNHPRLQELFALGIVDFAVFDAEAEPGEPGQGQGGEEPAGAESDADGASLGGVARGDGDAATADGAGGGDSNGSSRSSSGGSGGPGGGLWGSSGGLRLELSGEELRPGDLDNPVIVVANYVFDSLKQDAFRCDAIRCSDHELGWCGATVQDQFRTMCCFAWILSPRFAVLHLCRKP